jgi:hypothetical protein
MARRARAPRARALFDAKDEDFIDRDGADTNHRPTAKRSGGDHSGTHMEFALSSLLASIRLRMSMIARAGSIAADSQQGG